MSDADPPRWVLTTQADIDTCAEELLPLGYNTMVHRGDAEGARYVEIYAPDPTAKPAVAALGKVVIIVFDAPQVITQEQYEASPFYDGGS